MAFRMKLAPIIKSKNTPEKFAVFDIEAANWIKFLILGYYDGSNYKEFYSIKEFCDFLFSKENKISTYYAHFGGIYDFLFLLRYFLQESDYYIDSLIPRGSGLLCFAASTVNKIKTKKYKGSTKQIIKEHNGYTYFKEKTIKFKDSSALLPFGLKSLCESFNVEHKKIDMDRNFTKITPELKTYLKYDCLGLYEVLQKYHSWPLIQKAGSASTMASQALKVFRTFLKNPIYSLSKEEDSFVRKAYFGGRTEIFKPLFISKNKNEKLYCYDVNSLYPTVMLNDMPTNVKKFTDKFNLDEMGFYECEVEVPHNMYIPPLPAIANIDGTNKLIFPTGRFKGIWSTCELKYAVSLGVKIISTGQGLLFKNGGPIFKDFINTLYQIRLNAPKNSVDSVLAKLLMNSCYGRFGLKLERELIEIDIGQPNVKIHSEIPTSGNSFIRLVIRDIELSKSFTNVAISAWVTSLARIHMHKIYMKIKNNLYYTDTDSLFTTKTMPTSNNLGDLKLEYESYKACFLLPKTYAITSTNPIFKNNNCLTDRKIVMKGFDKNEIHEITFDDFTQALEGDLRRLKVQTNSRMAKFRTAAKKGNLLILTEKSYKGIHAKYDKRTIIKTKNGYDTIPLKILNNTLIK